MPITISILPSNSDGSGSNLFYAIGTLTFALLEFEFDKVFGRRRMLRDIDRLSGHYIICGAGRVGLSSARELARRPAAMSLSRIDCPDE